MGDDEKRLLATATDAVVALTTEISKLRQDLREVRGTMEVLSMRVERTKDEYSSVNGSAHVAG